MKPKIQAILKRYFPDHNAIGYDYASKELLELVVEAENKVRKECGCGQCLSVLG